MSNDENEERGFFSGLKKIFGGGKKPAPKKKAPKAAPTGFNKFKYAPGEGCGTGAGGFKAGNNCSQGAGFNQPETPKPFGGKGQIAASMPTKASDVKAYAESLKKQTMADQAVADKKTALANQKAKQKAFAANIVAKSKGAAIQAKRKALKEAEEAARAAKKRADEKAAAVKKAADRAAKEAAKKAAEEAAREAAKKAAAEAAAKRAVEKAEKAAADAAARKAAAEKAAADAAAQAKADQKAALQSMLDEKTSQIKFPPGDDSFDGLTLNGVKLEPPADPKFWETAGDSGRFKEPAFDPKHAAAKKSFGCIVVEPDGRVWVIEPKGHFGGYEHTFPKGGADKGESNQQAAMREVFEESGLQVKIQGHLGDYEKTTSVTRYYIAKRVGGAPSLAGKETGTVKLTPFKDAKALLNKDVDKKILDDAEAYLKAPAKKAPRDSATVPAPPSPPKPTIPQPSEITIKGNLGGSTGAKWGVGPDGKKYAVKQGNSSAHLKSEALADDLYEAAGVKVASKIVGKDAAGVDTKVAEFIGGKTLEQLKVSSPKQYAAAVKKLKKDFVADALLGNWDVVGLKMDNVIVQNGNVYRIDNGGALLYRAQGKLKGTDGTPGFGSDVIELSSMRDKSKNATAAEVYGTVTDKEVSAQITKLMKKKSDILAAAAKNPPVASLLQDRFDSLAKWQQDYKKGLKAASKGKGKVPAPAKSAQEAASNSPSSPFKPAQQKPASELSLTGAADIPKKIEEVYGRGEAKTNMGWLHALKSGITNQKMSWADRQAFGMHIATKLSKKIKSAYTNWNGSSKHVRFQDIKVQNGEEPSETWKSFTAGIKKMPKFVGGPVFRGMHEISPGNAEKWINTGEWTSAPYENADGTGKTYYGHQSFSTRPSTAVGFATTNGGSKSVLVVIKDVKTAKDGCGLIGYNGEHEVVIQPSARHAIDSYYWIYRGPSNNHIAHGATVTSERYADIQKKLGKKPYADFKQFHVDNDLTLVIEAREI